MKTFEVEANVYGKMTFEVKAKNKAEAQAKVDDLLANTALKEALKKYKNNFLVDTRIKEVKQMER